MTILDLGWNRPCNAPLFTLTILTGALKTFFGSTFLASSGVSLLIILFLIHDSHSFLSEISKPCRSSALKSRGSSSFPLAFICSKKASKKACWFSSSSINCFHWCRLVAKTWWSPLGSSTKASCPSFGIGFLGWLIKRLIPRHKKGAFLFGRALASSAFSCVTSAVPSFSSIITVYRAFLPFWCLGSWSRFLAPKWYRALVIGRFSKILNFWISSLVAHWCALLLRSFSTEATMM